MDDIMTMLNNFYITPEIENEELLKSASALYRELTPQQSDLCGRMEKLYTNKAFLLGLRTGAQLERYLHQKLT